MTVVDTNILVYATFASSGRQAGAMAAIDSASRLGALSITRQILREFISVVTRPQAWITPLTMLRGVEEAENLTRHYDVLEDGPRIWPELVRLAQTVSFAGKQVHDANIVATMLAYGERRLLTGNGKDFRRFEPMIEVVGL